MLLKIRKSPLLQKIAGYGVAYYLRFVRMTCRLTIDPPTGRDGLWSMAPVISAMWHGQHFLAPYLPPPGYKAVAMISRSADGEINATAARAFGHGVIRASGAKFGSDINRKGGATGFREALRALKSGQSVGLTADIPKGQARIAGPGIVTLAQVSGRPIVPMGMATSRRRTMNSWDKASLNLPFGRMVLVYGEPIHIPRRISEAEMEQWRQTVADGLNAVTERAYALADGHADRIKVGKPSGTSDPNSGSRKSESA